MKKLTNKKGFTLIEMLVVIAIIAVLVAIIIPVVSSSTIKAAAATNAANMRSLQSEVTTYYLSNGGVSKGDVTFTGGTAASPATVTIANSITYPAMKAVGEYCDANTAGQQGQFAITFDGNQFIVKYNEHSITDYATIAETGTVPAASGGGNGG